MSINWFPGHMAVAVKKIQDAMADHDVVIEILDARCPMASSNPLIESLRIHRQRPCLKVLNKMEITKYRDVHPEPVYLCTVIKDLDANNQLYAR